MAEISYGRGVWRCANGDKAEVKHLYMDGTIMGDIHGQNSETKGVRWSRDGQCTVGPFWDLMGPWIEPEEVLAPMPQPTLFRRVMTAIRRNL